MVRRKPETSGSTKYKIVGSDLQAKPCPICGRPSVAASHPFCSPRCSDIDLHRWLGGVYAVPSAAIDDDQDESTAHVGTGDEPI